ncbi:predicted protein [Nematostella vectensis]|uniref:DUF4605 domain-containing protein n=1 Tax=Nematostella vectensis TaxID=45351 RepID=A7SR91_NEMVE|nr:predicted protein [Nematostella vectensis]|eukprot:XP_001625871.1 predicted protein [Nematostella vectensis]
MVTIIDGEIVQDDDPRAQAYKNRNRRPENSSSQGSFHQTQRNGRAPPGPGGLGAGSMFDQFNNKLIELGFPRWNIGDNVVEPIVSVALLLALVFFGIKGVLMVAVVCYLLRQAHR